MSENAERPRAVKDTRYIIPSHDYLRRYLSAQEVLDFIIALRDVEGLDLSACNLSLQDGTIELQRTEIVL